MHFFLTALLSEPRKKEEPAFTAKISAHHSGPSRRPVSHLNERSHIECLLWKTVKMEVTAILGGTATKDFQELGLEVWGQVNGCFLFLSFLLGFVSS